MLAGSTPGVKPAESSLAVAAHAVDGKGSARGRGWLPLAIVAGRRPRQRFLDRVSVSDAPDSDSSTGVAFPTPRRPRQRFLDRGREIISREEIKRGGRQSRRPPG